MVKWVAEGKSERALFNLKLPMKKRYQEVQKCFALIDEKMAGQKYTLQAKHLFHDREEITVLLRKV
jgi:23S rRNA (cytidine2498-2'-O)-methyltransferase